MIIIKYKESQTILAKMADWEKLHHFYRKKKSFQKALTQINLHHITALYCCGVRLALSLIPAPLFLERKLKSMLQM